MLYLYQNGPMPTTAALVKVTSGTVIKTMLQLSLKSGVGGRIVEWGLSGDASAAATPIEAELIDTGTVAATVTAAVANDIAKLDGEAVALGDPTTALINVGTAATGYTATAEGTITSVKYLDGPQLIAPTNEVMKQFPLGRSAFILGGDMIRIRVTAPAVVNLYCYIVFEI